jgi:16S rRNA (adenine1518-N6/adenine1519-N6)-dimethyltransferase
MKNDNLPTPSELLDLYGKRAKKRYSQNFLADVGILDEIVEIAGVREGTPVLEIGPGPGGLTTRLLAHGADVLTIEADPGMVHHLDATLGQHPGIETVSGDVLALDMAELVGNPPRHVVANLPYAIATEVYFRILDLEHKPRRMALMFQKEVAERIAAQAGERAFGMLGLNTMFHYRAVIERVVKPGSFIPAPKVTSAVVGFRRLKTPVCSPEEAARITRIARQAFNLRRKMLRKSLQQLRSDAESRLKALDVPPTKRPEALTRDEWLRLADFLD